MSAETVDYGTLLRDALVRLKTKAPSAADDLVRFASQAGRAVREVTNEAAALEIAPIIQDAAVPDAYSLRLRKLGSQAPPSDLGVYRVPPTGYPILRWFTRRAFEIRPEEPDEEFRDADQLEGHFRWLVSNPDSRLVFHVAFYQQNIAPVVQ